MLTAVDAAAAEATEQPFMDDLIAKNAQALSGQLTTLMNRLFPPQSQKTLRHFSGRRGRTASSELPMAISGR